MDEREERVRERAQRIWNELGQPTGQDNDIWHQAEQQIKQEEEEPDPPPRRGGWAKPRG